MPEITVDQDQLKYIELHGLDKILKQHSRLIQKGWPRYRAEWFVMHTGYWKHEGVHATIRAAKRATDFWMPGEPRRVIDTLTGAVVWEKG